MTTYLLQTFVDEELSCVYLERPFPNFQPHANCLSKSWCCSQSSTLILDWAFNSLHRALIDLQRLTPYGVVTSLVIQLSTCSYLALITLPHSRGCSLVYFHSHFILRALLWTFRVLIPKPRDFLPQITAFHFTRWYTFLSVFQCHKKFLLMLSNTLLITPVGEQGNHICWKGIKDWVISVSLPRKAKY